MKARLMRWEFAAGVLVLTCFGVFVLPFFPGPPALPIVSASNAAGFNNKVAAVVAVLVSVGVFAAAVRWPVLAMRTAAAGEGLASRAGEATGRAAEERLPWRLAMGVTGLIALLYLAIGLVMYGSQLQHGDQTYQLEQIGKVEMGRHLYSQVEFPYGPVLFYGPVAMHALLSPLHVPMAAAYALTWGLEGLLGGLLMAYVIDRLPMRRWLKFAMFLIAVLPMAPLSTGLNYTAFRYGLPLALLVYLADQRSPARVFCWALVGELISLGDSAEMGVAFLAGAAVLFLLRADLAGLRGWRWGWRESWREPLAGAAGLLGADVLFMLLGGRGYLRMLALFSKGQFNFPVEPLPDVLMFLFALVWLVPRLLAGRFRQRGAQTGLLVALCVFGYALLPVAFGRADDEHVRMNGLAILMLSMVAVSGMRRGYRVAWVCCVVIGLGPVLNVARVIHGGWLRPAIWSALLHAGDESFQRREAAFLMRHAPRVAAHVELARSRDDAYERPRQLDFSALERIVGGAPVALPFLVPQAIEDRLKQSGQYVPVFFCFETAVLDESAETRWISEFNQSRWALLPNAPLPVQGETPEGIGRWMDYDLHYKSRRAPYVTGLRFQQNLRTRWEPAGVLGSYAVWHQR